MLDQLSDSVVLFVWFLLIFDTILIAVNRATLVSFHRNRRINRTYLSSFMMKLSHHSTGGISSSFCRQNKGQYKGETGNADACIPIAFWAQSNSTTPTSRPN